MAGLAGLAGHGGLWTAITGVGYGYKALARAARHDLGDLERLPWTHLGVSMPSKLDSETFSVPNITKNPINIDAQVCPSKLYEMLQITTPPG